tara:strand:+ start:1437 stop:2111 length:675 start_codon:yes stop_codon:yes gene_type:complete
MTTEFKEGDRVRIIGGKHKKKANFGVVKRVKKKFVDVALQVYMKSKEKGDAFDEIKEQVESVGIGNLEKMPEIIAEMPTMDDLKVVDAFAGDDDIIKEEIQEELDQEEEQVMFEKVGKDVITMNETEPHSSDEEEAITFEDLAKQEKAQRKVIQELQQFEAEVIARRQQCQDMEEQIGYWKDIALGHENHINSLQSQLEHKKDVVGGVDKTDIIQIIQMLTKLC